MSQDDFIYFERRAYEERRAANQATDCCAARSHSELANRYALFARAARFELDRELPGEIETASDRPAMQMQRQYA